MTTILNIDEIAEDTRPKYSVVIKGVEHQMKTPTLDDFIENARDMEALAAAPNVVTEAELTARMIARAFPTLEIEDVRKWPTTAIERLFNAVRGFDADAQVNEGEDDSGNAPAAS